VKFLVDENLPPRLAKLLATSGHDAVHPRDLNAASAPDSRIMELAADEDRIVVSADTDFGALLAYARATRPSVILVREIVGLHPEGTGQRHLGAARHPRAALRDWRDRRDYTNRDPCSDTSAALSTRTAGDGARDRRGDHSHGLWRLRGNDEG
jgi:hypothetical protein